MTATNDFAAALQAFTDITSAMTAWSANVKGDMPRPIYEAGFDAMADNKSCLIDAVAQTRAETLPQIAAKAAFIATLPDYADIIDPWAMKAIKGLADDLAHATSATGDPAFGEKLADYDRAIAEREAFEQANNPGHKTLTPEMAAFEDACGPFHDACSDAAMAVVTSPAPNMAALVQKQRVFHAQQMHHCGDTSRQAIAVLFADAIRFAGGAG
ncbi:MAG: hypothetical protein KYX66_06765 [Blastomonas fulva]|uniref:hypothetical protein n=1 Tax=Blastomonas fulva TaxID=1550728 RepID=UPI0024E1D7D9|nr:hypothetical protein [Blastomonas fulva]MDK2756421.1 hypothetical protein [Blastomonas fulva]